MARLSITEAVHHLLAKRVRPGDTVIDATLGNGHDALFLAEAIGESGQLFGFDIQPLAISNSRQRLAQHHLDQRAALMLQSHARMAEFIPERFHGHVACIIFNLGYLPGSDKSLTTHIESTISALNQGGELLAGHGCISILAYTGHAGGLQEYEAVKAWAERLPNESHGEQSGAQFTVSMRNFLPAHQHPPQWILIGKGANHPSAAL